MVWGMVEDGWRRHSLGWCRVRSGIQFDLRWYRQRRSMAGRTSAVQRQGQLVRVLDPCSERRHGGFEVVLPDGAGRFVGFRQRTAVDAGGCDDRWAPAQSYHAGEQKWLLLRAGQNLGRLHFSAA